MTVVALSGAAVRGASAATPSNPHANAVARSLYDYLSTLPGRTSGRLVSGQHMGLTTSVRGSNLTVAYGYQHFVAPLPTLTGRHVALVGADYGPADAVVQYPVDYSAVNAPLIRHWNDGGLVTVMFSARNPWTGRNSNDRTFGGPLSDLLVPGTAANRAWLQQLDNIATGLQALEDAGVVVLFRPLHEMNGAWFWWGYNAADPRYAQDVVALWRHMHAYLSVTKGLDNLLWVYNVSARRNPALPSETALYPGDAYVDVVSFDSYSQTFDEPMVTAYARLKTLNKPVALGEFGPTTGAWPGTYNYLQLLADIRSKAPDLVYFMAWSDYGSAQLGYALLSLVSNLNADRLLTDPWVVTIENLPVSARSGRTDLDRLLDWAEQHYPQHFPAGPSTQGVQDYQARVYATGNALGARNGELFVYWAADRLLEDLGTVSAWIARLGL